MPVNISFAQLSATLDAIARQEQEEVCPTSSGDMDAQGTQWAYRFWIPGPRAGSELDMRGVHGDVVAPVAAFDPARHDLR